MKKRAYIIAEVSGNHCNSKIVLKKIISGARKANANAVKMQYYKAENLTPNNYFGKKKYLKGIWKNKSPFEILKKSETSLDLIKFGLKEAKKNKLDFICSVFEPDDISILKNIGVSKFKVASLEATYVTLLDKLKFYKPIISLGALDINQIKFFNKYKFPKNSTLLYCVTKYPAKVNDYDLQKIDLIKKITKKNIGLSDHTDNEWFGALAASYGVRIFEKHVKLKNFISFDYKFSLDIASFKKYVSNIYDVINIEKKQKIKFKTRKIFSKHNLKKGQKILNKNLVFYRSDEGIEESIKKKNFWEKN